MAHQHSLDAFDGPLDPLVQCRQDIDRIDAVLEALMRERTRVVRLFERLVDETRASGDRSTGPRP